MSKLQNVTYITIIIQNIRHKMILFGLTVSGWQHGWKRCMPTSEENLTLGRERGMELPLGEKNKASTISVIDPPIKSLLTLFRNKNLWIRTLLRDMHPTPNNYIFFTVCINFILIFINFNLKVKTEPMRKKMISLFRNLNIPID